MKKIKIFLIILLFIPVIAKSQYKPVTIGLKAGVSISNFGGEGVKEADGKVGFTGGVLLDYNVDEVFFVRTGLDFTTKGAKQKIEEIEYTYNPMYFQIPLHVGYKMPFSRFFRCLLHAGPYFAYGIGGKTKTTGADVDRDFFGSKENGGFKKIDLGLGLAVGVEYGNIGIELGYDLGLVNISYNKNEKVRNLNTFLTLGYKF